METTTPGLTQAGWRMVEALEGCVGPLCADRRGHALDWPDAGRRTVEATCVVACSIGGLGLCTGYHGHMDENPYRPPQTDSERRLGKRLLPQDEVEFRRAAFVLLALGVLFFVLYAIRWF